MYEKVKFTEDMKYVNCKVSERKDGRFFCRVPIGYDIDSDGKKKYHYKSIYGCDVNDVRINRAEFIDQQMHEEDKIEEKSELFTTKIEEWLYSDMFRTVKPTYLDRLEQIYNHQILEALESLGIVDIKLKDVQLSHIQDIMNYNLLSGYSYSTLKKVHNFLKNVFEFYGDDISRNPMRKYRFYNKETVIEMQESLIEKRNIAIEKIVRLKAAKKEAKRKNKNPNAEEPNSIHVTEEEYKLVRMTLKSKDALDDIHFFNKEEIDKIKDAIENGYYSWARSRSGNLIRYGPFYGTQAKYFLVLLNTGLRCGEACALKYSDFDYEKKTLSVQRNSTSHKERGVDGRPTGNFVTKTTTVKTSNSKAVIPVSQYVIDLVKELQAEEPEGYDGYIVHNGEKHISGNALWKRFHKLIVGAGVEVCGLHSLRHTCATRMFAQTRDIKLVSSMLRHSDASFTNSTYVHQEAEYKRDMIDNFKI